jgi:outer membrane protein assembly factor BamB/tetratricopeptide (TPR) repeat protein
LETKSELDLLSLVHVARTPVPVVVAAAALNVAAGSIISTAQQLVDSGKLAESNDGYVIAPGTTVQVTAAVSAYLAGRLADAFVKNGSNVNAAGRLLIAAGRPADAWEILSPAALDPKAKRTDASQLDLLDLALHALERAQIDGGTRAAVLRLQLARLSRNRGDTNTARNAITAALPRLSGENLVDGLGFAAAIADDLQLPQEAEWWVALATLTAAQLGLTAKLGSLLTFHGRELSRIGFASEAQATLAKGNALLETHGSEIQRFYGALNQAWVDLDQGQMRKAEVGFARLRDQALRLEGEASQADKDAYWARALFGSGRPDLALESIDRAVTLAKRIQAPAPQFIAAMAQAEGGILYEQWKYGEEGAHRVVELVEGSLPVAWRNAGYYLAARALAGTGQVEAARKAVESAVAATPLGSNGIRWRTRIEGLSVALAESWDRRRAEDLTDLLLQSHWLGAAVDLMIVRSQRDNDHELAADAAILALEIGNPAQAALAIETGGLWHKPVAAPVLSSLATLRDHMPPGWNFMTSDDAEAALATASEPDPEDVALLRARIDEVLGASGLSGDIVLSPAQRQAAGLGRRRLTTRKRQPMRLLAAAAATAVIAVVSAFVVVNLTQAPAVVTTTIGPTTTSTIKLTVEDTPVAPPDVGLAGTMSYRADAARTGVLPDGGFRTVTGRYWLPQAPGGSFVTDTIAFGRSLYVATDENFIYGIEQTNGRVTARIPTSGIVQSPIAIGQPAGGEFDPVLVYGDVDGVVHAHSALRPGPELWTFDAGSAINAAPLIVDGVLLLPSSGGFLYAIDMANGEPLWQYPESTPTEGFESAPAFADGIVYVINPEGLVHMVDLASGAPVCEPIDIRFATSTNPIINGGAVFIGLDVGGMTTFAAGTCGEPAEGYEPSYPIETPVRLSPAVTPEVMFYVQDRLLLAMSLDSALWEDSTGDIPTPWNQPFTNEQLITTPPVLAGGVVYIGSQGGRVDAVDAETGQGLWEFNVRSPVRGETLVVPGAVFVGNANGELWPIAGE